MSLLSPIALLGLLGISLPILAHLLGREQPRPIPFAALRFLPKTEHSVTHRRQLRDLPLLLLRVLLLGLAVLVLARPATHEQTGVAVVAEVHDAILLVDGSRSMELEVGGRTLAAHALGRATSLLQSLPAGSRIGLVTTDPDGPRLEPTADPERVRTALEDWLGSGAPRPGAWMMAESLPEAGGLLEALGNDRERVIYALGDETARGLGSLPATAPGAIPIVPIPAVDPSEALPAHVALLGLEWTPAPELDPRAVRIEAVVRLQAPERTDSPEGDDPTNHEVALVLRVGDAEVARTTVVLEPGVSTPVEFTHTLLGEGEAAAATVELAEPTIDLAIDLGDDPLPSDDRRHVWLTADAGLEVLVVNGDPSELRAHDEVFFLTTAVAAADDGRGIALRSMAPDQLEDALRERGDAALRDVDVLILANVRAPAPDVAPKIVERVRGGMGLWISVGDRIDPDAYNAALGEILPLRMREVVQVGTLPGRAEARVEGIAPADLSHPAFKGLGGDLGLSSAKARKIVLLEPDPGRPHRLALSFTSGAPALLSNEVGQGRVALLTTTIDRDWADLPLRPGFVPMITGTLGYLGGARGGVSGTRVLVGEAKVLRASEPAIVVTPSGREVSVAPDKDGLAVYRETFVPGHYTVRVGDETSVFSVEVDPVESETQRAELSERKLDADARPVDVAVPRWRDLVLVLAGLLLLESVLRWRRR